MTKRVRILDDDLPFEEPTGEWFLPELRAAVREQPSREDLGLRRLAEFPEVLVPRRRLSKRLPLLTQASHDPYWPDAA